MKNPFLAASLGSSLLALALLGCQQTETPVPNNTAPTREFAVPLPDDPAYDQHPPSVTFAELEARRPKLPAISYEAAPPPLGDITCDKQCDAVCGKDSTLCGTACNFWEEAKEVDPSTGDTVRVRHCHESSCRYFPLTCTETNGRKGGSPVVTGGNGGGNIIYFDATRGMTAVQTSTAWGGGANRAVDGISDGNFWNGSVTHTEVQDNPGWTTNIWFSRVGWVRIYNRTDCCKERLGNFSVWFMTAGTWRRFGTFNGSSRDIIDIKVPRVQPWMTYSTAVGIVVNQPGAVLSMAEVQVTGEK